MSVPLHERKPSKMEFLNQTMLLEVELLQLIKKTPKAYQSSIGNVLFQECAVALRHGKAANAIYVQTQTDLSNRAYELNQMRGAIDSIPCHIYAWSNLLRNCPSVSENYKKTLTSKEERIAYKCELIVRMIDGLKKSDRQRFRKCTSGYSGKGSDIDDLIYTKSQAKREWSIISHLKSIGISLKHLEIGHQEVIDPNDLPEYKLLPGLAHRLKIESEGIEYKLGDSNEETH